jgi:fucose permease
MSTARSYAAPGLVYTAALLQGLTLVSFPASSAVLKQMHGFTDAQYGAIFLPQVALAVLGALAGGSLSGRFGLKTMFLLTLLANAVSQALLALSAAAPPALAYATVLAGTASLGFAFGVGGGPLNTYPRLLFPAKAGSAILALHATMGLGLSAGPLAVGALSVHGAWLAFPVGLTLFGAVLAGIAAIARFPSDARAAETTVRLHPSESREFWLLAAIAAVYAFAEGTFSGWAVIYVHESKGLSAMAATGALSAFWAALVLGRFAISGLLLKISPLAPWSALPVLIAAAFLALPAISSPAGAILGFGLAGLGCSAFFPLTVATASARFPGSVAFVSSMMTAALMLGSGLSSFAIGRLREVLTLEQLYRASTIYPVLTLALIGLTLRAFRAGRRVPA